MSDPSRWRDGAPDAPPEIADMLASARPPRPMRQGERAALSHAVRQIGIKASVASTLSPFVAWLAGGAMVAIVAAVIASRATRVHNEPSSPTRHREVPTASVPPSVPARDPVVPHPVEAPRAIIAPPAPTNAASIRAHATFVPRASTSAAVRPSPERVAVEPRVVDPSQPTSATPSMPSPTPEPYIASENGPQPLPFVTVGAPISPPAAQTAPVSVAREASLLNSARSLLAEHRPAEALQRMENYSAEYPHGQLETESAFVAIDALRALGRNDQARERCEAAIARHPPEVYVARLRAILDALR